MKLQDLLEERVPMNTKLAGYAGVLYRDCKKIMDEYAGTHKRLYRGSGEAKDPLFFKRTPRRDRHSSDTPMEISEMFDEYFFHKFGHHLRSESTFATADKAQAVNYGDHMGAKIHHYYRPGKFRGFKTPKVYVICPIGDYKIFSSHRVHDLYSDVVEGSSLGIPDPTNPESNHKVYFPSQLETDADLDLYYDNLVKVMDDLEYKQMNVNELSPMEAMIVSGDYYGVHMDVFEQVLAIYNQLDDETATKYAKLSSQSS